MPDPPLSIDSLARKTAMHCRRVIQSCLREEEWRDADNEFYEIIRRALLELLQNDNPSQA
ncbi:hypothetical protein SH668x_002378 [Planctomicrobium sp. SH668]|uniref:hypothetical protein n=1 Tax=Planctomicrobium sp. SH668 TaxID=3448126 RepID=UPI003F5C9B61